MEKKEISDRIKSLLVEDLFLADSVDEIAGSAELGTDLGMDSVGFVELATLVGEVFGIEVADTDIGDGHFTSVDKVTEFVVLKAKWQGKSGEEG
ncbi:acyl carrier protein|uniref:Acyl carrier protein n=1 Tax=Dendrosporobacter quercicolus TaxID=146817 RepID=A0A1G9LTB1_9FIRM|nr:acyl carrier protein [Dendrosporobacter quercicolus]NSL46821.1 acyl carrier protein [Dendrosporobacter quercicolus DSM 1736]SDL65143.1 acyl carrier protein [Dendrosporobacter quercicolus]